MADDQEPLEDRLDRLYEQIEAKRVKIDSYSGYAKGTFLAFDSFNLGVTTALDMLGAFTSHYKMEQQRARSTEDHQ